MLTHLSLFSGIGGLDLAAEAAGFVTVGQCEWADYPTKVLEKHWPDVPRWRDIRTLTGEDFYARTGLRTVDVISGGFPCQPFSVAGNQKGKEDDRYLWPDMLRVIRELTPRWVVGENVPGILRIAAGDVVADLEREGYDVAVFNFEAAAVGAPHRRERVFFVANADVDRRFLAEDDREQQGRAEAERAGETVSDADEIRRSQSGYASQIRRDTDEECAAVAEGCDVSNAACADGDRREPCAQPAGKRRLADRNIRRAGQWATEPDVGRVAHGIPDRVDRLKCLGNAVVPQQAYPLFKAIWEVEHEH